MHQNDPASLWVAPVFITDGSPTIGGGAYNKWRNCAAYCADNNA